MSDLVDALSSRPGLYVGPQTDPGAAPGTPPSTARIAVSVLPGGSGVMMAYEVLSAAGGVHHQEHAVLARTSTGLALVTSHTHADVTTVIPESEPGFFEAVDGSSPFPMSIRLEVPEPGHLIYTWAYGWDQEPIKVRDVGDVRLVGG